MPTYGAEDPLRPRVIPWSDHRPIEVANEAAAKWLNQQPGQGLVLTDQVKNAWLAQLDDMLARDTLIVGTKNTVKLQRWQGGAALVAWPSRKVLDRFRPYMARATALLVIEWAPDPEVTDWLRREEAVEVQV